MLLVLSRMSFLEPCVCRLCFCATPSYCVHPCPNPLQKDEFLRLAINAIHNDLISRNEAFQSLALTFVSNSEWVPPCRQLLHTTHAHACPPCCP